MSSKKDATNFTVALIGIVVIIAGILGKATFKIIEFIYKKYLDGK